MSEMTLLLFRPLLLPPKNLIVSGGSAKWTRGKRDEWGFVHRCENADGMGACGRAAVIEIYLKISNERCECEVGLGGGGSGECCVLVEEQEDVGRRTLISKRGGSCVAVGFSCVAVQLSGVGFLYSVLGSQCYGVSLELRERALPLALFWSYNIEYMYM